MTSYKGGELYLIGEVDLRTGQDLPFIKIGIVRDNDSRSTEQRIKEHQTGNPRLLKTHWVVRTPIVERIETALHGWFAPKRVSGEWFHLEPSELSEVHRTTETLASEAKKSEEQLALAESFKDVISKEAALTASQEAISLHRRLGSLKANLSACDKAIKELKAFFDSLHRGGKDVSGFHIVVERSAAPDFDEVGFQEKHPRLWQKYLQTKQRPNQRFVLTDLNSFKKEPSIITPDIVAITTAIGHAITVDSPDNSDLSNVHGLFLELLAVQAPLDWESELIEAEIKTLCGDASGIEGVCTWTRTMSEVTAFDKTSFKNDHPEKWEQFTTAKPGGTSTALRRDRNFRV